MSNADDEEAKLVEALSLVLSYSGGGLEPALPDLVASFGRHHHKIHMITDRWFDLDLEVDWRSAKSVEVVWRGARRDAFSFGAEALGVPNSFRGKKWAPAGLRDQVHAPGQVFIRRHHRPNQEPTHEVRLFRTAQGERAQVWQGAWLEYRGKTPGDDAAMRALRLDLLSELGIPDDV
jgi:hypothetical protein